MKRRLLSFVVALLCTGCDPKFWKMQMWMWAENHKSMDFYGSICDQYNRPVEGVRITAGVGTYEGPTRSGGKKYYTVSDANGRFSFTGIHGAGCGYQLLKDGYEFNQRLPCSSRPEDYVPDPNKPVVFPVWKWQGPMPMSHVAFDSRVPYDGQPAVFDIFAGRKANGGDLRVSLRRNPLQVLRGMDRFDWSVEIQVVDGGLTETSDIYPYEAPVNGYQGAFNLHVTKDTNAWTQRLTKMFYVRTSRGEYGRVYIDLTTDSERPQGTGITIECWLNSSGSRNLEFDNTKHEHLSGSMWP